MIIFDTDILSLLELPKSTASVRIQARLDALDPPQQAVTTVITFEEQSRGRLAAVSVARSAKQLADAYYNLHRHAVNYRNIPIIDFDGAAIARAEALTRLRLRVGTMDLRIAAIALARDALLISRNLRDFIKVPGLRVEDWTVPLAELS